MIEKERFAGFKEANNPTLGLAMIFDVSGFTNFFNKPDLQYYITDYINHVIECVEITIYGGIDYWTTYPEKLKSLQKPSLRKFLGDGLLYIWEENDTAYLKNSKFKIDLINRVWNLQTYFKEVNKKLHEIIPIADLPKSIKFGLAQGTVYKLSEADGGQDYIGPCINLASRLVKYCPEINFICSARLNLPLQDISNNGYMKIIANEIRSFEYEIVIIDQDDYLSLKEEDKARLFKELEK
ncbi:hypothetical protein [Mucilaginibacter lacusdianchii]|uniref:hypothetical protein n=1 Tax=Mucilaginibacter lacusdianchii TaxID=2684211 RepID=UPI00131AACA1|nr:hypothetical protein [Mucilaginibacter sp. JXJ CY 39]